MWIKKKEYEEFQQLRKEFKLLEMELLKLKFPAKYFKGDIFGNLIVLDSSIKKKIRWSEFDKTPSFYYEREYEVWNTTYLCKNNCTAEYLESKLKNKENEQSNNNTNK